MRAALIALLALAACAAPPPAGHVTLRLVAFNDFHGHIEPPPGGLGGAAHLAGAIAALRREAPHSAVVAAGDLVSASPFASSIFRDEPAVNALSAAGLELSAVGNHEFDRGRDELLRLQRGGCAGPRSCYEGAFPGARFRWLAANVFDIATGRPFLPAYEVRDYGGVRVAFVGAVLRGTPVIVSAGGVRGLEFRDEAESVNALVPELRARGIEAIVLLIHEGGRLNGPLGDPDCPSFAGPIVDIVRRLDRAVDVVVSGHTHDVYVCRVAGRLVTSAGSYGRMVTAIDLVLDRRTGDVARAQAQTHLVEPQRFTADAAVEAVVRGAVAKAMAVSERVVGRIEGEFTRAATAAGESNLGDLVADAQLAAMRRIAGAQVALMNPGGLRAELAGRAAGGAVTFGDIYAVQPFENTLVAMTLTGEQLLRLLERQWRAPPDRTRILQAAGLAYAWDGSRPLGSRVVPGSVRVAGEALDPAKRYRIAVNSFLAGGGDGFTVLAEGVERQEGPQDLTALEEHLSAETRRAGAPAGRITRVDAR